MNFSIAAAILSANWSLVSLCCDSKNSKVIPGNSSIACTTVGFSPICIATTNSKIFKKLSTRSGLQPWYSQMANTKIHKNYQSHQKSCRGNQLSSARIFNKRTTKFMNQWQDIIHTCILSAVKYKLLEALGSIRKKTAIKNLLLCTYSQGILTYAKKAIEQYL